MTITAYNVYFCFKHEQLNWAVWEDYLKPKKTSFIEAVVNIQMNSIIFSDGYQLSSTNYQIFLSIVLTVTLMHCQPKICRIMWYHFTGKSIISRYWLFVYNIMVNPWSHTFQSRPHHYSSVLEVCGEVLLTWHCGI